MTDDKILKQALKKAVENGYKGLHYQYEKAGIPFGVVLQDTMKIIFSHKFAISFWGEKMGICKCHNVLIDSKDKNGKLIFPPIWQYHLQQLVLEKNPLKYLEQFLK